MGVSTFPAATGGGGSGGSSGPVAYAYSQGTPASTWTITHNLGFYPNVTVIDSSNAVCVGDVSYPSINQMQIVFSGAFSGTAYLS